jgi:hypothetical protein
MSINLFSFLKQIPTIEEELIRVSFRNSGGQLWFFYTDRFSSTDWSLCLKLSLVIGSK